MITFTIRSNPFDNNIAIWFSKLFDSFPSALKEFVEIFSALGDMGIFLILLSIVFLIIPKTRKLGTLLSISLVVSLVMNNLLLKNIFARTRPFHDPDLVSQLPSLISNGGKPYGLIPGEKSFPSGHTFSFFICLTSSFLYYIYNKEEKRAKGITILLLAMSLMMGLSRLLLSHHYATDVIAAILFGIAFGTLTFYVYKNFPKFVAFIKTKLNKNRENV